MLQVDVKLNPITDEGSIDRVFNQMIGTHNSKPMVGNHNGPMENSDQMYQQKIRNSSETMDNFDDVMSKLKDSFRDVLGSIKALAGDLDTLDKKLPATLQKARKDDPTGTTRDLAEYRKDINGVVGVGSNATGIIQSLSYGNIAGGVTSGVNMMSNQAFNMGNAAGNLGMGTVAKGLMGVGGVLALTALGFKAADSLSDTYEDALSGMDSLNRAFGGDNINRLSATRNSDNALSMRGRAVDAASGTGLKTEEFIQLATSLSAYGINDESRAFSIAKNAGNWNRYTGADSSQIANFAGLMERYGGNGEKSIEQAYKAARASGLDKSQFGEFLSGLQSVVENGIAKGFVRSADDVSESLANISLLSGNSELWSGKAGIQRYEQMGSAMSNATSLNSTSSMLLYQAMKGKKGNGALGRIDLMSEIEKGDWGNADFLASYRDVLNSNYNGDAESQIATIKENFGLNWTGAKDFYEQFILNTKNLSSDEIQAKMNEFKQDPTVKSDAANMTDALNKLDQSIAMLGQDPFRAKAGLMDGIASDTRSIAEILTGKKGPEREYTNYIDKVAAEEKAINNGAGLHYMGRPNTWEEILAETTEARTTTQERSNKQASKSFNLGTNMSLVDMIQYASQLPDETKKMEAFKIIQSAYEPEANKDKQGGGGFSQSVIPELWEIIKNFGASVENLKKMQITINQ